MAPLLRMGAAVPRELGSGSELYIQREIYGQYTSEETAR